MTEKTQSPYGRTEREKQPWDQGRIDRQNKEFDAVNGLAHQWRRLSMTPVVDDDYPEVRFGYEQAMRTLIDALKANRPDVVTGPAVAQELRTLVSQIRRRPTPIKDIIPLLDRAATELERRML